MRAKKYSLQMLLAVLALISALPPLGYGVFLMYKIRQSQQQDQLDVLVKKADSTANTVQQLLLRDLGVLESLSTSSAAQEGDTFRLYQHAQRVLKLNPDINAISLVGPDLNVKFLTSQPYGSPEFSTNEVHTAQQVFMNGSIQVSEPFMVEGVPAAVTSLSIPIYVNGKVAYCLRAILRVKHLTDVLAGQDIPPNWIAAIIHKNGQVVARLNAPETLAGQMSPPAMIAAIKADTVGWFRAASRDGKANRATVIRIHDWDWYVALGVPEDVFFENSLQAEYFLLIEIVLVVISSMLGAYLVSRYVTRNLNEVLASLRLLREGDRSQVPSNPIVELDRITQIIKEVSDQDEHIKTSLVSYKEDRDKAVADLEHANLDALTGLPGRGLFLKLANALHSSVAQGQRNAVAVLFIDLDGFKSINDTQGHAVGDTVLKEVGSILRSVTRETDIACRLGGDEFVICIGSDRDQIENVQVRVAQRIIQMVAAIDHGLSCSVGIAGVDPKEDNILGAIQRADLAMYQAKRNGKNRYSISWQNPATISE
jgi:diguanylate cyclase (GGDEF)-like protein